MKKRKYLLALMSTVLSLGFLVGCNNVDEDEPDPTEEPSEQIEENEEEAGQEWGNFEGLEGNCPTLSYKVYKVHKKVEMDAKGSFNSFQWEQDVIGAICKFVQVIWKREGGHSTLFQFVENKLKLVI